MAISCQQLSTSLARQTPVYSETFLKDFISDMPGQPFVGKHQTEMWEDGAETVVFDKMHVGQPDFTKAWNRRRGADCGMTFPTRNYVAFGSTRDEYFMENQNVYSQLFSLDQLRTIPKLKEQMTEIYRNIRRIPLSFTNDYLRTRTLSYMNKLYICGNAFTELALTLNGGGAGGIDSQANVINLGSSANLPTSDLTWTYLTYYSQLLGLRGYNMQSGLPTGMRALVTHPRTYQRLVGLNPEVKAFIKLNDIKSVSPLFKPGVGINAEPFGEFAPVFDENQLRYQDAGNGYLERVLPYKNIAATTGIQPDVNPDWLNARYAITYVPHPMATVLQTPKPKKIMEQIPTVNTSMWGNWGYHNEPVLAYTQQDGSQCTIDNANQFMFYWLCYMELGFKYAQRNLMIPILHLIDGAGKACMVDNPICGAAPQYVLQNPSDAPAVCQV